MEHDVDPRSREFDKKVDDALLEYITERIAALEAKRASCVGLLYDSNEDYDAYLVSERRRFDGMTRDNQVLELLNNFHAWWPTGFYRDIKLKDGASDMARSKALVDDLDGFITRNNYGDIAEKMPNREGINPKEYIRIASEAYLYLREKGYGRLELVV